MKEIWKDIEEYEGYYQVSNLGRIKSLSREKIMPNGTLCFTKERILSLNKNRNGYMSVSLYKNNKRETFRIHRLVAIAFIPNPNNLTDVNHKDENKENNCVDNLEWCDKSYNNRYGTKIERQSDTRSYPIYQYDLKGNLVKEWISTSRASKEGGFNYNCIKLCLYGKNKTHKGYFWSREKHENGYFKDKLDTIKNKTCILKYL